MKILNILFMLTVGYFSSYTIKLISQKTLMVPSTDVEFALLTQQPRV